MAICVYYESWTLYKTIYSIFFCLVKIRIKSAWNLAHSIYSILRSVLLYIPLGPLNSFKLNDSSMRLTIQFVDAYEIHKQMELVCEHDCSDKLCTYCPCFRCSSGLFSLHFNKMYKGPHSLHTSIGTMRSKYNIESTYMWITFTNWYIYKSYFSKQLTSMTQAFICRWYCVVPQG